MTVQASPIRLTLKEILLTTVTTYALTAFSLTYRATQFYLSSGTNT
jgi:hypothetical protein